MPEDVYQNADSWAPCHLIKSGAEGCSWKSILPASSQMIFGQNQNRPPNPQNSDGFLVLKILKKAVFFSEANKIFETM